MAPQGQQVAQPVLAHNGGIVIQLHVQRRGHKLPAHIGCAGHAHIARQQKKMVDQALCPQGQQFFYKLRLAAIVHNRDMERHLARGGCQGADGALRGRRPVKNRDGHVAERPLRARPGAGLVHVCSAGAAAPRNQM